MTLTLSKNSNIYKNLFTLKRPQRDGLILNIHHTDASSRKVRFIYSTFCLKKQTLALSDNEGNVFLVDFNSTKFWNLPKLFNSVTILEFSTLNNNEVLVGDKTGTIYVTDIQSGQITGELLGHASPVKQISFSSEFRCISCSRDNAILWDLHTNTKIQILSLSRRGSLKFVVFVPVFEDILACFEDDCIQIWKNNTFEVKTQLPPLIWFNHAVRNAIFTKDGKVMALACRPPHLALFHLHNYKLFKFITLPEYIQNVNRIEFIPQANDGGAHKIIAILSGRGSVYFYDIEQNAILSELVANYEIANISVAPKGAYISCTLCSGDVNVYNTEKYAVLPTQAEKIRAGVVGGSVRLKKCLKGMQAVKKQIRSMLDTEKLRIILKEFSEYPGQYRTTIWEQLLGLPGNKDEYNSVINHRMILSFEDLALKFPLENKRALTNLRRLLDNLVAWNPFFHNVEYLPNFVFPFVKVFQNKPVACFEAVCTIIMNWCQYWFEYFPLPPINILGIIENILMEADEELLNHFVKNKVTAPVYAWQVLKSVFSEVLPADSWKIFWDHVLTNEPGFLLCAVVAYNILQREKLLHLYGVLKFESFFKTHHPVNVRKLIKKTYSILENTSPQNHPRQYLKEFEKIEAGVQYPNFCEYPKTILQQNEIVRGIRKEYKSLRSQEMDLYKKRFAELKLQEQEELDKEEQKRQELMQKAMVAEISAEKKKISEYEKRLADLRQKFGGSEDSVPISSTRLSFEFKPSARRPSGSQRENELLQHYAEMLKAKYDNSQQGFEDQQNSLSRGIGEFTRGNASENDLRVMNLFMALQAMDKLMENVENEIKVEQNGNVSRESLANARVMELKSEARELEYEVNKLLTSLANYKNRNQE